VPRVSVLVPCFNQGAFLDEAVDSVLAQTFDDYEIVIVDDGSTDDSTRRKLEGYQRPKTRVLRTRNRGLPAARNAAAAAAGGSVFCALDADDRLEPSWFEKGLAVLDGERSIAFVSHWLDTFGDEQWTWRPERCDLPAMLARNAINGAALVRREAFEAVGGYDERMRDGCEDWDFWLRLIERGFRGAIVPEVLFHYRRTAGSMSRVMLGELEYRAPLQALIDRHADSYRAHLIEVLVSKEVESLALLREIHGLERDHLVWTLPSLARAHEELAAVESAVARARPRVGEREELDRLRHETAELRREVADLRQSWSWRLTSPLRAIVGRIRGEHR
jgi:glycosyltransferase involved in cell wall biosynthesis